MSCVIAFMDDLMFLSRVREAAKAESVDVKSARKTADLLALASDARLVLVDLDSARLPVLDALKALRADPLGARLPVIGFFSHVHVERAQAATEAGCSRVMARGAFVAELPELLRA